MRTIPKPDNRPNTNVQTMLKADNNNNYNYNQTSSEKYIGQR